MIIEKMPVIPYVIMQIVLVGILMYYIVFGKLEKDFKMLTINIVLMGLFCMIVKAFSLTGNIVGIGLFILLGIFFIDLNYILIKRNLMRELFRNKVFIFCLVVLAICLGVVVAVEVFY